MTVVSYYESTSPDSIFARVTALEPHTVAFDVEPLVARWNTDTRTLDAGIAAFINRYQEIAGIRVIAFITNSHRIPSRMPAQGSTKILYRSSAAKPFRAQQFRELPTPGVLIGDQIATDGILAYRLKYHFIRYIPARRPIAPFFMDLLGAPLRHLFLN